MVGSCGQKRQSGLKGSRDFDNEIKEEGNEMYKAESRPSPNRRTQSRERSRSRERGSSGGRRVSRSPGRRSEAPGSSSSTCDMPRQQPAKMVSVPATKCALFGNGEAEGANLGEERDFTSHSSKSRSAASSTGMSNENVKSQSLSQSFPTKANQSPYKRDPMAEIDKNSLRNQNGGSTSMFKSSKEVDKRVGKSIKTLIIHKAKPPAMVEEAIDAKVINEVESPNQITLNRTRSRSSCRSSHDLDNNPGLNPISYATFLLEEIQDKQLQQNHQNTAFSFPTCVSMACCIETITDLNSSCSEKRSYKTETLTESELKMKDDSTARESAGSNSFIGQPWASPLDLNSVDSSDRCYTLLSGNAKEVDVEDEAIPVGTH